MHHVALNEILYHTWKNFATDKANGKENFGQSDGKSLVVTVFMSIGGKILAIQLCQKFSRSNIFIYMAWRT